jgi:hypothetical protein
VRTPQKEKKGKRGRKRCRSSTARVLAAATLAPTSLSIDMVPGAVRGGLVLDGLTAFAEG